MQNIDSCLTKIRFFNGDECGTTLSFFSIQSGRLENIYPTELLSKTLPMAVGTEVPKGG